MLKKYKYVPVVPAAESRAESWSERSTPQTTFRGMNRFMTFIISMALIPWIFGGYRILGFNVTGWTWVISLALSGIICCGNIGRISFPFTYWFPWVGFLGLHWFLGRYNPQAAQSFFQTISPVVVGCAASIFHADQAQLKRVVLWISKLAIIVWILFIICVPVVLTGAFPEFSFMAAQMIGVLLLGSCYAAFYACGRPRFLYHYLAMLLMPLVSLTRGPIVAMLSCLPFTPAPLKLRKRILLCLLLVFCGVVVFNTDRIQKRMFFSGSGELSDLYWGNPDLATTGRSAMWDILWEGSKASPWFGNGWNSHRIILIVSGIPTFAPHNDWLKILYDIGVTGVVCYMLTIFIQMFALVRIARRSDEERRLLAYGAATAFIPYMLIMFTDNVVLYVQFFGNLHFALIGIVYGSMRNDRN